MLQHEVLWKLAEELVCCCSRMQKRWFVVVANNSVSSMSAAWRCAISCRKAGSAEQE